MPALSELNIIVRASDQASMVLDNVQRKAGMTTQQFRKMGTVMTGVGIGMAAGLGMMVKKAADFEQAIINAASVTGLEGKEFEDAMARMSEKAEYLGRTTAFTAVQIADAMYDLASKGFKPAEMSLESLKAYLDLAAATQSDLTMTTETVTATIRMFGFAEDEATRVSDVFTKAIGLSAAKLPYLQQSMKFIGPVAKAMGLSLEETVAVLTALYDRGIDASSAATGMRQIMAVIARESPKLTIGLSKYGLSIKDIDIQARGFIPVMKTLADAQIDYNDLVKMFNVRSAGLISALTSANEAGVMATDTMNDMQQALEGAGGTAERVAGVQLSSLTGQLTIMKSALEGLAISIGTELIPYISRFVVGITNMINKIREVAPWFTKLAALGGGLATVILLITGPAMLLISLLPSMAHGLHMVATGFHHMKASMTAAGGTMGMTAGRAGMLAGAIATLAFGIYQLVDAQKIHKQTTELYNKTLEEQRKMEQGLENDFWNTAKAYAEHIRMYGEYHKVDEEALKTLEEQIQKHEQAEAAAEGYLKVIGYANEELEDGATRVIPMYTDAQIAAAEAEGLLVEEVEDSIDVFRAQRIALAHATKAMEDGSRVRKSLYTPAEIEAAEAEGWFVQKVDEATLALGDYQVELSKSTQRLMEMYGVTQSTAEEIDNMIERLEFAITPAGKLNLTANDVILGLKLMGFSIREIEKGLFDLGDEASDVNSILDYFGVSAEKVYKKLEKNREKTSEWTDELRGIEKSMPEIAPVSTSTTPTPSYSGAPIVELPSYQGGGIVPGPKGAPRLIIAHGGERVGKGTSNEIHLHIGAFMGREEQAREFARIINRYIREETRRTA